MLRVDTVHANKHQLPDDLASAIAIDRRGFNRQTILSKQY